MVFSMVAAASLGLSRGKEIKNVAMSGRKIRKEKAMSHQSGGCFSCLTHLCASLAYMFRGYTRL